VNHGNNQEFIITPDTGYHVADVLVDGSTVGAVSSYTFPGVTEDHTISASFAINQYIITATAGTGGNISPLGDITVTYGDNQEFTITSDTGYHITEVIVDGISQGAIDKYTFYTIESDHTITASFAINTYTITASAGPGGSISPSGDVVVLEGGYQNFTITPNTDYYIQDVLVDDESEGPVTWYNFTNVFSDQTIAAYFDSDLVYYTITASAGNGGTITPSGDIPVVEGGYQNFTITTDTGYHIADVLVDGSSIGVVDWYNFTDVEADRSIAVSFSINTYTITATAGTGGNISPSGDVTVNYGANQEFIITANTNYHIADVLVDSVTVGAVSSYTFEDVIAGHTITASFALNLIVDSEFSASVNSSDLRTNGAGQDWYESRKDGTTGPNYLTLDTLDVSGNSGQKAKLTGLVAASGTNAYLTQELTSTQTGTFTFQFDIYVDQIFDRSTDDDRGAAICAGIDDGGINGPVSRGAERFVYLMFAKVGGGSTGSMTLASRTSSGAVATTIGTMDLDKWYTMRITVKVASNNYDVQVYDGATPILTVNNIAAATSNISPRYISFQTWNDGAATFYVDNVHSPAIN
jgi:hypothetical protein